MDELICEHCSRELRECDECNCELCTNCDDQEVTECSCSYCFNPIGNFCDFCITTEAVYLGSKHCKGDEVMLCRECTDRRDFFSSSEYLNLLCTLSYNSNRNIQKCYDERGITMNITKYLIHIPYDLIRNYNINEKKRKHDQIT